MAAKARSRYGLYAGVLAAFVVLSVVMTWPLTAGLGQRVLGAPVPGDSFYYLFLIRWLGESVWDGTPMSELLFAPEVFFPFGYNLALSETSLAQTVPALPLATLFGEVVAYNVVALSSFVLSGLAAYLLVKYHTGNHVAALFGGVIYAFSPYRLSHLGAGHLPLMGTQWLPLLLLYLDKMVVERKTRSAALAALFYALGALSSWYYAYIFAMAGGAYVLLRGRPWRAVLCQRSFARPLTVFLLGCVVLVGSFALPLTGIWRQGGRPQSLRYLDHFSASPLDFVYPNVMQPVWGARLLVRYPQNLDEKVLFLGLVPTLLAVVALSREGDSRWRTFAALGAAFAVLALGTSLHWGNAPLYIGVPAWLERFFTVGMGVLTGRLALFPVSSYDLSVPGAVYLPMPTLLLYLYLPFFSSMRVWARQGLVSIVSISVLAGGGLHRVRKKLGQVHRGESRARRAGLLTAALFALVIIEFAPFPYALGTSRVEARPVDEWLANRGGDFAIMEFPVTKALSGRPLYAAHTHGKGIAFGYGTFFPRAFDERRSVLDRFPSEECVQLLREWGVRYVLVGSRSYAEGWPQVELGLARSSGLQYVLTLDDRPIYDGDRLLHLLPGTESAFVVDRIHVYEVL